MKQKIRQRIEKLSGLLKDPSLEVRVAAAAAIEKLEAKEDLESILNTLKTGDTGSRVSAIYALGKIGGERVLAPLLYCADRPEDDLRAASIEVLGTIAIPSTVKTVVDALEDKNTAVQVKAIEALKAFPPTPEITSRLRTFLQASDGTLEAAAAITLANLGDIIAVSDITDLLESPHPSTRAAAAEALSLLPF